MLSTFVWLKFIFLHNLVNSIKNLCAGHNYVNEGVGDRETSSSCCSPGEVGGCSLELVDNYPFDDEIERRLSEITPIPVCLAS